MMMRILHQLLLRCWLLLFVCSPVALYAQEDLPILIDKTPFVLIDDLDNDKSFYTDVNKLKRDWPLFTLPKGLVVKVIGCDYDALLRVELPDGSLGFIPTVAVAGSEVSFRLDADKNEYKGMSVAKVWPKGSYVLERIGRIEYMKKLDAKVSLSPEYYEFKHEGGQRFRATETHFSTGHLIYRLLSWDGPAIFEKFFANHPAIVRYYEPIKQHFKLKNGELPTTFLGCSRSYIESVLGEPYCYAGYAISPYKEYTFSCHTNVAWDIESSEDRDDSGLMIYYDKNQIAVHMAKVPIDFYYDDFFTKLYTPRKAVMQPDPEIAKRIAASPQRGSYHYGVNSTEHVEHYTKARGCYPLWAKMIYLFENELNITNRWAIFGLLLAFSFVVSLLICLAISKLPFSNGALQGITLVAHIPLVLFVVIYLSRFYILAAILAILCVLAVPFACMVMVFDRMSATRCDHCRKWLNDPKVVREEYGKIQVSDPSITLGTGIRLGSSRSTEYRDGRRIDYHNVGRQFKTTVTLTTPITQTLRCPHCGYEWRYTRQENETAIGPLCYTDSSSSTVSWRETEITKEQIKNRNTGEVLHEEETGRREVNRSASGPSSGHNYYDYDRYKPYLHRYINGDRGALYEYERRYYGKD